MKDKEPIVIYWSPIWDDPSGTNWNLLYQEPEQLFKHFNKNRLTNKEANDSSNMLNCPAISNKFKQTYMFLNPTDSHLYIEDDMNISYLSSTSIGGKIQRGSSFKDNIILRYFLGWSFFTEEDSLEMNITAPYFHRPKYLNYGAIIPGSFDIGKWFRPYNAEFNLWNGVNEFKAEEGEPLFYVEFMTDRPIILKRFINTDSIHKLAWASADISNTMGRFKPLVKRYEQFAASRNKELVLKEIKNNLLS
jgi:hypothetical protein